MRPIVGNDSVGHIPNEHGYPYGFTVCESRALEPQRDLNSANHVFPIALRVLSGRARFWRLFGFFDSLDGDYPFSGLSESKNETIVSQKHICGYRVSDLHFRRIPVGCLPERVFRQYGNYDINDTEIWCVFHNRSHKLKLFHDAEPFMKRNNRFYLCPTRVILSGGAVMTQGPTYREITNS